MGSTLRCPAALLLKTLHRFTYFLPAATCQSGYGAVCKTVYPGSIPGVASKDINNFFVGISAKDRLKAEVFRGDSDSLDRAEELPVQDRDKDYQVYLASRKNKADPSRISR